MALSNSDVEKLEIEAQTDVEKLKIEAQKAVARAKAKRAQILMNVQLMKVKQLKSQIKGS